MAADSEISEEFNLAQYPLPNIEIFAPPSDSENTAEQSARESAFVNFRSESEPAPILKGIEAACVKMSRLKTASVFGASLIICALA